MSPVEQARKRRGRLTFGGVRLWRAEGPNPAVSVPGDWLTAEGPIAEANTELGRALGRDFVAEP